MHPGRWIVSIAVCPLPASFPIWPCFCPKRYWAKRFFYFWHNGPPVFPCVVFLHNTDRTRLPIHRYKPPCRGSRTTGTFSLWHPSFQNRWRAPPCATWRNGHTCRLLRLGLQGWWRYWNKAYIPLPYCPELVSNSFGYIHLQRHWLLPDRKILVSNYWGNGYLSLFPVRDDDVNSDAGISRLCPNYLDRSDRKILQIARSQHHFSVSTRQNGTSSPEYCGLSQPSSSGGMPDFLLPSVPTWLCPCLPGIFPGIGQKTSYRYAKKATHYRATKLHTSA